MPSADRYRHRSWRDQVVWWDSSGICLFAKTLEETRFCWPKIAPTPGAAEPRIDWRLPQRTWRPEAAG
ncbi:IS66 family insertion sequence element accessory protein TnpB [Bradyrhizobium sp. 190]|uniref:IS66 family insertion sequence element accessory protein TnpB n=1 Tax=Bradyrhizobium sp. 190 TaxID=2782658 RepID=UPI0035AC1B09|nr:IS66 family insertion sequence element accessory protein TnpB [Bradyrhizobium sp. 190]